MILAVNKAVNFWKVEHGQMKIKFQGDCQIESELCISCKDLYVFTYVDKSTVTQYINVLFSALKRFLLHTLFVRSLTRGAVFIT